MVTNNGASPLLADDQADETPALGGGGTTSIPMSMDLEDQSPLERLIAQSTSEQRCDIHGSMGEFSPFRLDDSRTRNIDAMNNQYTSTFSSPSIVYNAQPSIVTLLSGTFCLLQIGFVFGSFLSSSWFDTHLLLSLPVVKTDTDQLLHSTTLASLLSNLLSANEGMAAMSLMVTALILPCLFAVSGPVWTIGDRKEQDNLALSLTVAGLARWRRENDTWFSPRNFIEYILRICFLVFFLMCIVDIGTSSIEMNHNNTRFTIINRIQGGFAAYTLGMSSALLVIVLLRIGKLNFHEGCYTLLQEQGVVDERRAPPNQAFQLPWNIISNNEQEELQTPLLNNATAQSVEMYVDASTTIGPNQSNPNHSMSTMDIDVAVLAVNDNRLPFWKRAILYEFAILSTLLWLPALFFSLFELTYDGIISDYMEEVRLSVRLWEFPVVFWQRGTAAGTSKCVMIILCSVIVSLVYVLPLLATLLAIAVWRMDPSASTYCRNVLWTIQPCLGGIVFFIALHFAIPGFEAIGEYAIDMGSSGLCKKFEIFTSDTCLTIQGHPSLGLWFLMAQSVSLEIMVGLTMFWSR